MGERSTEPFLFPSIPVTLRISESPVQQLISHKLDKSTLCNHNPRALSRRGVSILSSLFTGFSNFSLSLSDLSQSSNERIIEI